MLEWFLCRVNQFPIFSWGYTEHNRKLKFIMYSHLTHINTIFEYCHASVVLDNVDVLYLEN